LPFHPGNRFIAASSDGEVIAQTMWLGYGMSKYAGGWILHPNSPQPRWVERGISMHQAAVSKDGSVAILSGGVYETATGKRLWKAPQNAACCLSPDGRRLVTSADGGRVFAFGTWEPGVRVGGGYPHDISPDSRLVVMGLQNGVYRLVELATGRELARLESPDQTQTHGGAVFTSDGTKLVAAAKHGVRVWDLRLIRKGLKELGLDWDAPPYPEAPREKPAAVEVRILGGATEPGH
jgi:hypothetical protein